MTPMTSRDRVIAAMQLRKTDRTPVLPCLWLNHIARVAGIPYSQVLAYPEQTYEAAYKACRFYDADGLRLLIMPPPHWREGTVVREVDGQTLLVSQETERPVASFDVAGGGEVKLIDNNARILNRRSWPIGFRVQSSADLKKLPITSAHELQQRGQVEPLRKLVEKVGKRYFIAVFMAGNTINSLIELRGPMAGLMDMIDNPALTEAIIDHTTEACIEEAKAVIDTGVDGVYIGDSSASCSMISPQQYRRFCFPAYKRLIAAIGAHDPEVKIYQHCCGNYNPILEAAADEGADALHGLDPTQGMDIADCKRRVGKKVCLWGGVNTMTLLNGSPEDVITESRACMHAGGEEGYILDAACAIPPASPLENVAAMCKAPQLVQ